jgi:transcriptional/translational regulatory protein YebC/TACO1
MKPPLSPDPNANPRLAAALQKAKEGGVPKSGVENALARVSTPCSLSIEKEDNLERRKELMYRQGQRLMVRELG